MNLAEIRESIFEELRFGPSIQSVRDEVERRVNRLQRRICAERRWEFMQRLHTVRLKAQVDITASITESPGSYGAFALSVVLPTGWDPLIDPPLLAGHLVDITADYAHTNPTSVTTSGLRTYVIERAIYDSGNLIFWVDPRYPGAGNVTTITAVSFRFLRYRMPGDVLDLYNLMLRDDEDGPIGELSLRQESEVMLNDDDPAGVPGLVVLSPNRPTVEFDPAYNYPHTHAEPPHDTLVGTSAAGGSLTAGEIYQYKYVWWYAGLVSSPSNTVEVTIGAGHGSVDLTGLELGGLTASDPYGRVKVLFRRRVYTDRFGPWFKIAEIAAEDTTYSDEGTFKPFNQPIGTRLHDWPVGQTVRHFRTAPLTDADRSVEFRYHARVPDLSSDTDEPMLPEYAHMLLVHGVVAEMAPQADGRDLRRHHEEMYKQLFKTFKRRELGSSAIAHRRRSIFAQGLRGPVLGTATWTG